MSDIVIRPKGSANVIAAVKTERMSLLKLSKNVFRAVKHEPAVRRAISRSKLPNTSPVDWFSGVDDETWLWMHLSKRIRRRQDIASLLPGLPPVSMQETFTGSAGFSTLYEGFLAYQLFKRCYETHVGPIENARGILDFGCGWGRIIRFFLKDVRPEKITGVDQVEKAIQCCLETNRWCNFKFIEPYPPVPLTSESFDLIYLYSVFSHLSEEMHWELLKEFHRLLRPAGMVIATTRRRDFIEWCRDLREDPALNEKPDFIKCSAKVFTDTDAALLA